MNLLRMPPTGVEERRTARSSSGTGARSPRQQRRHSARLVSRVGFAAAAALALNAAGLVGCSNAPAQPSLWDPLDCEFVGNSGFSVDDNPLDGEVRLDFRDGQFGHGAAPERMKGYVSTVATNWFNVVACGRDSRRGAWQLFASWSYLPVPVSEPIDFPAYPAGTGELIPPSKVPADPPMFGATLEYCGSSCERREWLAFDGPYFPNSFIRGSARVDAFDYCGGRFTGSAELAYVEDSPRPYQGPMKVSVSGTWTPASEVSDGNVNPQTGKTGMVSCAKGTAGSGSAGAAGTTGIAEATSTSAGGGAGGTSGS